MTIEMNPYQAPETSIVEPAVTSPRSLGRFASGVICLGAALVFGLIFGLFFSGLASKIWEGTFSTIPPELRIGGVLMTLIYGYNTLAFLLTGVLFFQRRKGRARWSLLAAMAGLVSMYVITYTFL